MTGFPKATIAKRGLRLETEGLRPRGQREMIVEVHDLGLVAAAEEMLRWVVESACRRGTRFRPGETIAWGHWQLRILLAGEQLRLEEADPSGAGWRPGATFTFALRRDQRAACAAAGAEFMPPWLPDTVRTDDATMEGALPLVAARRRPADADDTGWTFVAGADAADATDAKADAAPRRESTRAFVAARPDLARWLALAPGFRLTLDAAGAPETVFDRDLFTTI